MPWNGWTADGKGDILLRGTGCWRAITIHDSSSDANNSFKGSGKDYCYISVVSGKAQCKTWDQE